MWLRALDTATMPKVAHPLHNCNGIIAKQAALRIRNVCVAADSVRQALFSGLDIKLHNIWLADHFDQNRLPALHFG